MQALWAWLTRRDNATILSSATLWVNLLTVAAYLAANYAGLLPPACQPYVPVAAALINAALVALKKLTPEVPGPEPQPVKPELHPIAELVQRVIDALLKREVKPEQVEAELVGKVQAAVREAALTDNSPAEALLKELKQ